MNLSPPSGSPRGGRVGHRHDCLHQLDDRVDDFFERHVGAVDQHGVVSLGKRRRSPVGVDLVALGQRLLGRGRVGRAVLGRSSRSPRRRIGDQEELEVGVGSNRRADVAALDDDAVVVVGDRRHAAVSTSCSRTAGTAATMADRSRDVLAANRLGDVDTVGMDRRVRAGRRLTRARTSFGRGGDRLGIAEIGAGLQAEPRSWRGTSHPCRGTRGRADRPHRVPCSTCPIRTDRRRQRPGTVLTGRAPQL